MSEDTKRMQLTAGAPEAGPDLRLVPAQHDILVHTTADRRLAVKQWLLAGLDGFKYDQARMEWEEYQVTLMPLGVRFCAVRLPERLVHRVVRTNSPRMSAEYLAAALDDGPVIHDPRQRRYYALAPASMPERWQNAASYWETLGVSFLGRGSVVGIPRVDCVTLNPQTWATYWAVPMPSAGVLCDPMTIARLIAAAHRSPVRPETEA
ncbi:hypothetical protein ACIQJT_02535 [Streptomyces sp. NPDC091972]|uniref:hypothetical protein n=1 Tax=Streptomyces sp. NPDC091972 TaxID=3366007 RepID=UPI00380BDD94